MIKLGEYDFNDAGETGDKTFSVAAMKLHENYNEVTYENDIAIMRLDRPATFSNSIWPICLPDNSRDFTNTRAFVIGKRIAKKKSLNANILFRLGHNILWWAHELHLAGGECESLGAGPVRD